MPDSAMSNSIGIAAYLGLFGGIGVLFVFVNLLIGRFLRPKDPHAEKLEIYECGEPAIGSSFVQFDLRFYVVALIFIIFDVEVAFLFPWATVFGKANHLVQESAVVAMADAPQMSATERGLLQELGVREPTDPGEARGSGPTTLLKLAILEVLVFFVILLIGFAYVWKMGALDWVRAITQEFRAQPNRAGSPFVSSAEPAVSA